MSIKSDVEKLAPKFSAYSESRMPYTFHHDYMRMKFADKYSSRSDVAQAFRDYGYEHLYSIAFLYLVHTCDAQDVFEKFSVDEFLKAKEIIKEAKQNITALEN